MMDKGRRPRSFYVLGAFFAVFVLFLYGPMSAIIRLSFQGPAGGLTFPMNGVSTYWVTALFAQQRVGDFWGAFQRSLALATLVTLLTVVLSLLAGLAFRKRFPWRHGRLLSGGGQPHRAGDPY